MPFLFALVLAVILMPVARRAGFATGLVDRPSGGGLKIQAEPVPILGGVAVIVSTLAALAVLGASPTPEVVAGVGIALGAGLLDDVRPVPPWLRTAVLVVGGAVLASGWFPTEPVSVLKAAGVILLVLASSNAVNLIDGQDGLAGGLAGAAALGLAWLAAKGGQPNASGVGLALAGALGGFLLWNRPPARIYLGNGGAYGVGTVLAVLTTAVIAKHGWPGLLATGACLGVFAFELVFTVLRRIWVGQRLASGDRLHSYDVVAARTGSRPLVTGAFCAVGTAGAGFGLILLAVPLQAAVGLAAAATGLAAVAGLRLWLAAGRPRAAA